MVHSAASCNRVLLAAACLLLILGSALAAAPGPGRETGPGGKGSVPCRKGYFKPRAGTQRCGKCPPGTIQPVTGRTACIQCALDRTNNPERTFCKKLPPGVKRRAPPGKKPSPTPRKGSAADRARADANVRARVPGCKRDGDGGRLCHFPLAYRGATGRTGVYYLPKTYKQRALPVMILLHGSGVNGNWMLQSLPFKQYADKHQVIMVAPDSRNNMFWSNPSTNKVPFSLDFYHIEGCWQWFVKNAGARINKSLITINGNSRAGFAAPALATRSYIISATSAIIMHAAALPQQMGYRKLPILWTTGIRDPLYGPAVTRANRRNFMRGRRDLRIYYREFTSSHSLNKAQEIDYIVRWSAQPSFRNSLAPRPGTY